MFTLILEIGLYIINSCLVAICFKSFFTSLLFNCCLLFVIEVRPAPHMDNLVSIYKNMETAAGVNIHTTQKQPVINSSGTTCYKFL